MSKREFILQYLTDHVGMASWDWDADLAYAKEFYPDLKDIAEKVIDSYAVSSFKMSVHKQYLGKVQRDRLKQARKLVNEGLVDAAWMGNGPGSSSYGVTKSRVYSITQDGRVELRILKSAVA